VSEHPTAQDPSADRSEAAGSGTGGSNGDGSAVAPPATGLPAVDEALGRLTELDQQPVSEHHTGLAAAHEVLHAELDSASGQVGSRD
jgi:hypothetical protein